MPGERWASKHTGSRAFGAAKPHHPSTENVVTERRDERLCQARMKKNKPFPQQQRMNISRTSSREMLLSSNPLRALLLLWLWFERREVLSDLFDMIQEPMSILARKT
jgi:hypothetical protein